MNDNKYDDYDSCEEDCEKNVSEYKKYCKLMEHANIILNQIILSLVEQELVSWEQIYDTINVLEYKLEQKQKECIHHSLLSKDSNKLKCKRCGKEYECESCNYRCFGKCSAAYSRSNTEIYIKYCESCCNTVEYLGCSECGDYDCYCGHPCGCTC